VVGPSTSILRQLEAAAPIIAIRINTFFMLFFLKNCLFVIVLF